MRAGISVLLSGLGASLLLRYLMISNIKQSTITNKMMKNGHLVLKYNKIYGHVGMVFLIMSGMIGILPLTGIAKIKDIGDIVALIFCIAFPAIDGILLMILVNNVKIEVSDDKIKYYGILKMPKEIFWDQIKRVECSKSGHELKLLADKKSITVSTHMIDYLAFEVRMRRKLDKSICEEALKKVIPF